VDDAALRALVRRVTEDPGDEAAAHALAVALARSAEAGAPPAAALAVGRAALVYRPFRPREQFRWRVEMDRAIARIGRVVALDPTSAQVAVPGVGTFFFARESLFALDVPAPEPGPPRPVVPDPGELRADGQTDVQHALLDQLRGAGELQDLETIAARAGLRADDNFLPIDALAALFPPRELRPTSYSDATWAELLRVESVRVPVAQLVPEALAFAGPGAGALLAEEPAAALPGSTEPASARAPEPRLRMPLLACATQIARDVADATPLALLNGLRARELFVPSHDPGELIDALLLLLERPRVRLDDVLAFLHAPDLVEGGSIAGDFRALYETGRGALRHVPSIEVVRPTRIEIAGTPADVLAWESALDDSVRASRIDGVDSARVVWREPGWRLVVDGAPGAESDALVAALRAELPLERELRFALPSPLVEMLSAFLTEARLRARSTGALRTRLLVLRRDLDDGGRRTKLVL
jgi:hypothetical protein